MVSFHCDFILIYHLGDEQYGHWWPQRENIVSHPINMKVYPGDETLLHLKLRETSNVQLWESEA
jgi:hypothetical protein